MKCERLEKTNWHLISLIPKDGLNGNSFINVLKILEKNFEYKYITLWEFMACVSKNGFINEIHQIHQKITDVVVFSFEEIYKILDEVEHFEWVDFFLYKDFPRDWHLPDDWYYQPLMKKSDCFVRGVDDQYIYIYTPLEEVVKLIKASYPIEELDMIERKKIDDFKVPF